MLSKLLSSQIIIYNCTGGGSETNPKTNSDLASVGKSLDLEVFAKKLNVKTTTQVSIEVNLILIMIYKTIW